MRVELDGGQFVGVLGEASTLRFFNRLVEGGDERLGGLRVDVDLRVVAVATFEGVAENCHQFGNGAGVGRFGTAAAVGFGDGVIFRHFRNLFKSESVALTYTTIHKFGQRATTF